MEIMSLAAQDDPPRPPKRTNVVLPVDPDDDDPMADDYEPDLRPIDGEGDLTLPGEVGGAIRYSQVSRRWRQIALDNGAMWAAQIGFLPDQVEEMVKRSLGRPLHVTLHGSFDRADIAIVLSFLEFHPDAARRVFRIDWYEHRRAAFETWIPMLSLCDLGNLTGLKVVGSECEYDDTERRPKAFPALYLPSLRFAHLVDVVFSFPISENLTELSLCARDQEHEWLARYDLKIEILLDALNKVKDSLQVLELDYPGYDLLDPDTSHPERIEVCNLMHLTYCDRLAQPDSGNRNTVAHVFDRLLYPADAFISLELYFTSSEAIRAMPSIVDTLQVAGMPSFFGLRVRVALQDRVSIYLSFYSRPFGMSEGHSQAGEHAILDATFGDTICEQEQCVDKEEDEEGGATMICEIIAFLGPDLPASVALRESLSGIVVGAVEVVAHDKGLYDVVQASFLAGVPVRWVQLGKMLA